MRGKGLDSLAEAPGEVDLKAGREPGELGQEGLLGRRARPRLAACRAVPRRAGGRMLRCHRRLPLARWACAGVRCPARPTWGAAMVASFQLGTLRGTGPSGIGEPAGQPTESGHGQDRPHVQRERRRPKSRRRRTCLIGMPPSVAGGARRPEGLTPATAARLGQGTRCARPGTDRQTVIRQLHMQFRRLVRTLGLVKSNREAAHYAHVHSGESNGPPSTAGP